MPNEKMMILNMLQEGKITADEAAKLLSNVDGGGTSSKAPKSTASTSHTSSSASNSNDSRRPDSAKSGSVDFDELGRKFASFAKDLEPKFQKATEFVAETTVTIADKLSKSIENNINDVMPRMPSGGTATPSHEGTEQNIELMVEDGYNEISMAGLNADVQIKGYNGDKISAKIRYKTKRRGASIELIKLGGKYYLNYEEDDFAFVAIDAYIPSHKFKIANISGINGNMDVSALNCQRVDISCSNGQTKINDITTESLQSESGNGKLTLSNITANTAIFEHFNGAVDCGDLDVEKLSLTNVNGSLSINMSNFNRFMDYLWNVETSNAKLTVNVPTLPDLGYHVRASATLGTVRVGLTGLEYLINDPGRIEARNTAFDKQGKKVRLSLETSNANLMVN